MSGEEFTDKEFWGLGLRGSRVEGFEAMRHLRDSGILLYIPDARKAIYVAN